MAVGSRNSSNSIRLGEVAEQEGVAARLIDDETELEASWFTRVLKMELIEARPERVKKYFQDPRVAYAAS